MEKHTPWITYAFSYILRRDGPSSIEFSENNNSLSQEFIKSYPVPFNSVSSIRFGISNENLVKIKVYNSLGKEIKTLLEKNLSPGEYNIQWEARDIYGGPLPSGIYFISLQTEDVVKTTKTILLK
jgi:flagellar hook assembly protein FlgD